MFQWVKDWRTRERAKAAVEQEAQEQRLMVRRVKMRILRDAYKVATDLRSDSRLRHSDADVDLAARAAEQFTRDVQKGRIIRGR